MYKKNKFMENIVKENKFMENIVKENKFMENIIKENKFMENIIKENKFIHMEKLVQNNYDSRYSCKENDITRINIYKIK